MLMLMTINLVMIWVSSASICSDDLDCSLNGLCSAGHCRCAVPWMGTSCALLNRTEAPNRGIFGFSPNITSTWGGNVLRDDNGTFHLYASEIDGGLTKFIDRSRVAHAVSSTIEGPYTRLDLNLAAALQCYVSSQP